MNAVGWVLLIGTWSAALFPLAWWFGILADASWFAVHLGRWPRYEQPDPKDPSLPPELRTLWPASIGLIVTLAVMVACLLLVVGRMSVRRRVITSVVLLVIAPALAFGLLWFDPGGLTEWWFD